MTTVLNGSRLAQVPPELLYLPNIDTDTVDGQAEPAPVKAKLPGPLATLTGDLRGAWFTVAEPPTLMDWVAGPTTTVTRVPDNNGPLRWAWTVDNWTTGLIFVTASTCLFTAAASLRWLACHPARRWAALLLTCAVATYLLLA